jgi:hypothetical protein
MAVRKCCRKSKKEVVPNFLDDAKTSINAPSQTDSLSKAILLYRYVCGISLPSNILRSLYIAGYI